MNENILYVTPDGIAIDKDGIERAKEISIEIWESIKNLFQKFKQAVKDLIGKVASLVSDHLKKKDERAKQSWLVPKSTVKYNQVMNRKPMVSSIRNRL